MFTLYCMSPSKRKIRWSKYANHSNSVNVKYAVYFLRGIECSDSLLFRQRETSIMMRAFGFSSAQARVPLMLVKIHSMQEVEDGFPSKQKKKNLAAFLKHRNKLVFPVIKEKIQNKNRHVSAQLMLWTLLPCSTKGLPIKTSILQRCLSANRTTKAVKCVKRTC